MHFNKLDLNLLVALDALLAEHSITRAAERLNLSQSAMSNALGRLRAYFDDDLLVQLGRKMELTPRALTLQDPVRDVLVRIDTTIATPPQFDCTTSDREFTLSISDYSMEMLMPHTLALAARQHSVVRFKLVPQLGRSARALERGEADLLIIPTVYCSADHPTEVLFSENYLCTVWNGSSYARDGLSFEQYASAGHVVVQPPASASLAFEDSFMQRMGISRRIEVRTYSFTSAPPLVVGTEFVATVHSRLARRLQRTLPITLLPVPLSMPPLEQAMQWHKYRSRDPGMVWLRDLMQEAAAEMCAQAA